MPNIDAPSSDVAEQHETQSAAPGTMTKTTSPPDETRNHQSANSPHPRPDIGARSNQIAYPPDACIGAHIGRTGIGFQHPTFGRRVPEMANKAMDAD
jgi:hypothetical protein